MTTRNDIQIDFIPSPRIAEVTAPSVEFIAQDIVDTLRIQEESFRGQTENKLVNASGKEDLGSGVQVGITVELQDTQVAFEGRTTPAQIGTVTTASTIPVNSQFDLFDTNATFITNNIHRGSLVINFTDESIAEVRSIESETQLKTKLLVNGITNTFSLDDNYQIFNVIQCDLTGGNVVAIDDASTAISPVLPTAFTQVIRTASSSATIVKGKDCPTAADNAQAVWEYDATTVLVGSMGQIQRRNAFNHRIFVSVANGLPGTTYPLGTATNPVDNMTDAVTIGITEGIRNILVDEDVTISATDIVDGFTISGSHASKSEITILSGASTQLTQFFNCTLTGTAKGRIIVRDSVIDDILDFEGIIHRTAIVGSIRLSNTSNVVSYILECHSGVTGSGAPELDFFNTPHSVAIRAYSGGIKFINKSQAQPVSVDFISGQLILDVSVTAGEIVIRGVYHLTDTSIGTTIVRNTNVDDIEIKVDNVQVTADSIEVTVGNMSLVIDDLIKYQRNKSIIDPINFTLTIYEDDGITPLTTFDLKDENGVASILSIFQRIPQ